jgi:pimeloyl-ACP methyl ester carboxylesterase
MRRVVRLALQVTLVVGFVCDGISAQIARQDIENGSARNSGTLLQLKVHTPALTGNKLGDPSDQDVAVYLPPSYSHSPARRYPALYVLHGYDGNPEEWTIDGYQGMHLREVMDELINERGLREMIVVVPNGRNAYLGSFYTNSTVTGNWEDYIVRDLISYVDGKFRTIPHAESRGVTGHSMGGYGAITLGMKHPDVFAAVYAMSPCCLAMVGDLTSENKTAWNKALRLKKQSEIVADPPTIEEFYVDAYLALAAAFSPDPNSGPLFAGFPYEDRGGDLLPREPAWSKWRAKMPVYVASEYKTSLLRLHGLAIDYGYEEEFSHIPIAVQLFSTQLDKMAVPHTVSGYTGTHSDHIRERFENFVLPYFSRLLKGESVDRP